MSIAKDDVQRILDQLPEDASFEDIQYHIYVRQKIGHGLNDVAEGRVVSQEAAENRMAKWRVASSWENPLNPDSNATH